MRERDTYTYNTSILHQENTFLARPCALDAKAMYCGGRQARKKHKKKKRKKKKHKHDKKHKRDKKDKKEKRGKHKRRRRDDSPSQEAGCQQEGS